MTEFYADMRDIRFNLFDWLNVGEFAKTERFAEIDAEVMNEVVGMAYQQAAEVLHPLWQSGDQIGAKLVDGRVRMPEGWKEAYELYRESGWFGLSFPEEHGGQGFPYTITATIHDLFIGANGAFILTPGLTSGALGLIIEFGTDEQKAAFVDKMVTGEWSGTMCLTEASAGSAVPDLRTTARPIEGKPGFYKIEGQKIFITAGDHDMADNVVHMVLARVEGDPQDYTGISLFVVPKFRPDKDGKPGKFNDVNVVAIEEKMGIHASPTCQLAFGDEGECEGWLLGGQGNGLRCMFKMMNEARMEVGLQGVGMSNYAYQLAVRYAKERVQGTRIEEMKNPNAERVAIVEHPDVRRMLMHMKAIAEASRAMCYYAAYCFDKAHLAEDKKEAQRWEFQAEILTPICKAWCSDEGFRAIETGVQVHGGYGYIREYGMEQLLRDAKIASLYEGTNGIQALDLLGRKVSRKGGVMLMTTLNEINGFLKKADAEGAFAKELDALGKAREALAKTSMGFAKRAMKGDVSYGAMHATGYLEMFGDVFAGWLLLDQAQKAKELYDVRLAEKGSPEDPEALKALLTDNDELRYLHGKMETARFFINQIMPRVHARAASIDSEDRSALEMVF